jgi:hypothetical protein
MSVRAIGRRHNNPAALIVDQVAHEVVRELDTRRFGHRRVVPRTSDRNLSTGNVDVANGMATYLRSVLSGDDHGYVGCLRHRRAHRSQQHAGESTTAMTTDDDELRRLGLI